MASLQFTEQQQIPSLWRILIFGSITLFVGFIAVMVYLTEWNTMPDNEKASLLTLLLGPAGTLVLFIIRLDIRITSDAFEYKVHPFRKRFKSIPFSKISEIELTKAKPFRSMKGLGTHRGINSTEYNFGGKNLVILRMTSGRMMSFSTSKPQELRSFLENFPDKARISI